MTVPGRAAASSFELLRFDAGGLDHLGPLGDFDPDVGGELLRRAGDDFGAFLREALVEVADENLAADLGARIEAWLARR